MAMSAKERKLSRLGSGKGSNGGGGSFGARGGHRPPPAGTRRRLFAAFFAFLGAGAVVFGGVHAIGGEPLPLLLESGARVGQIVSWSGLGSSVELIILSQRCRG
jgi:hypothetical protein